tara:strand:- start:599 stop:799 length:201 start_codon:yes stop_codon:yes gene_type:complete
LCNNNPVVLFIKIRKTNFTVFLKEVRIKIGQFYKSGKSGVNGLWTLFKTTPSHIFLYLQQKNNEQY